MTKKSEQKAKVKGADQEVKVLKKIQDGNKAAKEKSSSSKKDKENKGDKVLGKRTFEHKDGNKQDGDKKPKAGCSKAPILTRRQKQKVSDLLKKLRVSRPPLHLANCLLCRLDHLQQAPDEEEGAEE